jgi:hypothetical protein
MSKEDPTGKDTLVLVPAEIGAEFGSVGGPVGAAVGGAVGLGVGVAAHIAIGHQVWHNQGSTSPAPAAHPEPGGDKPLVPTKGDSTPGSTPHPQVPQEVGPGPHAPADGGVPLSKPYGRPTKGEREAVAQQGEKTGCHTCGTKDFGTPSGKPVVDHQPPQALNPGGAPAKGLPQCAACSASQGGKIAQMPKPAAPPPPQPDQPSQ